MSADVFEFGEFILDCARFELRRGPHPVRLERKPLELLILLASSGDRLVTRDEIARCLWPSEVFVDTEHGINTAIRKIRHALREYPDHPRFLHTVTGKGYRFTGVTTKTEAAPATPPNPSQPTPPTGTSPEPTALVVRHPERTGVASEGPLVEPTTSSSNAPGTPPVDPQGLVSQRNAAAQPATSSSSRSLWLTGSIAAILIAVFATLTLGVGRVRGRTAPGSINPAALDAYQHAQYLWFSNNQGASGEYFLKATQLAPNYAPAWAGLANFYGAQIVVGALDPRENLPLHDAAAHRAVQLGDNLASSHLSLAANHWLVDWNYPAALKEIDRALQLDPRYTEAHHLRAKLLGQLNRHEEAIAEQRVAMQMNPFERRCALGFVLLLARRYDAAIAEAHARLEGNPEPHCWFQLAPAYSAKGMQNDAENALEQAYVVSGNASAAQALHAAYAHGGTYEVLLWRIADLQAESQKHYVSPFRFAELYAALGENQQALDALDETVRQHSPLIFDLQNESYFDRLHTDPHFRAIVQKIGLPLLR